MASDDKRQRYKFVQEALEAVDVAVYLKKGKKVRLLSGYINCTDYVRMPGYGCIVFVGGGAPRFLWEYLSARIRWRVPLAIRLGADPVEARTSRLLDLWKTRNYIRYFKVKLNLWTQVFLLRHCNLCFAVSEALSEYLKTHYGVTNVFTLPRTIAVKDKTVEEDDLACKNGVLRILSITNLSYSEKYDGIMRIMDLLKNIPVSGSSIEWRILGGGEYGLKVHQAAQAFSHDRVSVSYLGFCSDVESHYRWADIFVYVSELDWLPNVLLEAKAFGLPILLHDYPPLRCIFPRGGALFFDANSKDDFYSALHQVKNMEVRLKMADINKCDIEAEYSAIVIGNRFKQALGWSLH